MDHFKSVPSPINLERFYCMQLQSQAVHNRHKSSANMVTSLAVLFFRLSPILVFFGNSITADRKRGMAEDGAKVVCSSLICSHLCSQSGQESIAMAAMLLLRQCAQAPEQQNTSLMTYTPPYRYRHSDRLPFFFFFVRFMA